MLKNFSGGLQSSHLCDADEDVGRLLLKQVVERVFPGLLEQLVFDGDERRFAETLHGQNHPVGKEAVHQDPEDAPAIVISILKTSTAEKAERNPDTSALVTDWSGLYLGGIRWMPHSSPEEGLGGIFSSVSQLRHTVKLQSAI